MSRDIDLDKQMPEEFDQIKSELRTNIVPIVIGATAILLVAVGIYLFASRGKVPATPQVAINKFVPGEIETPIVLSQGQPEAVSPLAGFASPTPVQAPIPAATPAAKAQELPKSGFPALALLPISLALIGGGFVLRRKTT